MLQPKQKVTTFLWFEKDAEQAARFYVSVFKKDSKVVAAWPMGVTFRLRGQEFFGLNGGPHYRLTPAVSLYVDCKDQREVDYYWNRLIKGGAPSRCGWLTDRYGLSWQIIPRALIECLHGKDRAGSQRATAAMMKMVKLDVKKLRAAYAGS